MGYEIMYKKVFLKATDEMGVDLYTPVCLIGPNKHDAAESCRLRDVEKW